MKISVGLGVLTAATAAFAYGTPPLEVALVRSQLWLVEELTGFQSPSGNVGCSIDVDMVRCDIAERNWAPPPRPADCHPNVGSGQGLMVWAAGTSEVVCAGDTTLGYGEVLPYGDAIQAGRLQCDSTETAMRCFDRDTKHGFSLSREGYELF
ncbi:hypothetical protein [Mycobacterium sp. C31M]